MRESALDHRRFFDLSDDLQLAATHATLNIKVEHAFEKACAGVVIIRSLRDQSQRVGRIEDTDSLVGSEIAQVAVAGDDEAGFGGGAQAWSQSAVCA